MPYDHGMAVNYRGIKLYNIDSRLIIPFILTPSLALTSVAVASPRGACLQVCSLSYQQILDYADMDCPYRKSLLKGRLSITDLLVLTSSDQLLLIQKIIIFLIYKRSCFN
jgi:hypothetical protein